MALNDEGILPAIIVEIFQPHAPTGGFAGERAKTGFQFLGAERTVAVVMEDHVGLVRKLRDKKVGKAIVVVILKDNAHAGEHLAVVGKGRAGIQAYFGKGAVTVVVKKKLLDHVVGDKNICIAIAIIIREGYAQPFAFLGGNPGSDADIFKRAISAIVIQDIANRCKFAGWAIGGLFGAARLALLDAPIEIASNKQIEFAVVIVIEKPRGDGPTARSNTCLHGDIGKRAVAIVVVQDIFAVVGHVNVWEAVIVVVSDRNAHSVVGIAGIGQTGLFGDVGETPILILAIETVPVGGIMAIETERAAHGIA